METDEYSQEDEAMEVDGSIKDEENDEDPKPEVKEEEPQDPAMAEWFKIEEDGDENRGLPLPDDSDTESENDSDNADVAGEEPGEDGDMDDWFTVKAPAKDDEETAPVHLRF